MFQTDEFAPPFEPTEEQRAQVEAWLHAHPYGEQNEDGIDISLLRENLRRTADERWQRMKREMIFFRNARIIRRPS